jgi:hypothetical protein
MTSTRNKNTPSDYNIRNKAYDKSREWIEYTHSSNGKAYETFLPNLGFNPSYMHRSEFSSNSIDIETSLFGINSTNLVKPAAKTIPHLKTIPYFNYFENTPLIMPEKLVVQRFQRPYFIP